MCHIKMMMACVQSEYSEKKATGGDNEEPEFKDWKNVGLSKEIHRQRKCQWNQVIKSELVFLCEISDDSKNEKTVELIF